MAIKIYKDLEQGTQAWLDARTGLLTASEMKHALSKKTDKKTGEVTYKVPDDDKSWSHVYELAAQRLTKYVEPSYIGSDMLRGKVDEVIARDIYAEKYAHVEEVGFITNDKWGFTLGYSPDGLVGDDGLIEIKSRKQKIQLQTIIDNQTPEEHYIQTQTGLLVSERQWIDYISYCGGMMMATIRVFPDPLVMKAIEDSCFAFENKIKVVMSDYYDRLIGTDVRLVPTERIVDINNDIDIDD
jgi:hypothetical protein